MRNIRKPKRIEVTGKSNIFAKVGDMLANLFVVMIAALFAEMVIGGTNDYSVTEHLLSERAIIGICTSAIVFIASMLMYKKGGW